MRVGRMVTCARLRLVDHPMGGMVGGMMRGDLRGLCKGLGSGKGGVMSRVGWIMSWNKWVMSRMGGVKSGV